MKKVLFFLLIISSNLLSAQNLFTTWRLFPTGAGNTEEIKEVNANNFLILGKNKGYAYAAVVNKLGKESQFKSFKTSIGGLRSEFTDGMKTTDGYVFLGDCDQCVANDPSRKIMLVKTDNNFNVTQVLKYGPPTNIPKQYSVWGYQKLRKDGNKYVVLSQLINDFSQDDQETDFAITKISEEMNVEYNRAFDNHKADNIADIQVLNDGYAILNWSVTSAAIGADTSYLYKYSKDGEMVWEKEHRGVGLTLAPLPNGNWMIGGALTENIFQGPQSMLLLVNGDTGDEIARGSFGGSKIDHIRDLKLLPSGELLGTVNEEMEYPTAAQINQFTQVFSYPPGFPLPKVAKVMRFNTTTLQSTLVSTFPNSSQKPIVLRAVLPLANGQFVACGAFSRKPLFYSLTDFTIGGTGGTANRSENPSCGNAAIFPNPANLNTESMTLELGALPAEDSQLDLQVFDLTGRQINRMEFNTTTVNFATPKTAGIYLLKVNYQGTTLVTKKFTVTR